MPAICEICGYRFRRRRNLLRHQDRYHASVTDDWMDEPLCSIQLPSPSPVTTDQPVPSFGLPPSPSPMHSPSSDLELAVAPPSAFADSDRSTPPPSPLHYDHEDYVGGDPPTPKGWLSAATQTDPWSPTRRVRKQLFQPHRRTLKPMPTAPLPDPYAFGLQIDVRDARRLCDCGTCVAHNLHLLETDAHDDLPTVPGVRYVHLALPCSVSSAADRRRLDAQLKKKPQATFVVCGCARCGSHRDLVRAYREALRLTPVDSASVDPTAKARSSRRSTTAETAAGE